MICQPFHQILFHLEKIVIDLRMDALRMWNIALAGTACGNLLTLIENAYGYPKSRQSIECGQYLETVEWEFAENEPDAELAKGLTSKEAAMAEATSLLRGGNSCLRGQTSANYSSQQQSSPLP